MDDNAGRGTAWSTAGRTLMVATAAVALLLAVATPALAAPGPTIKAVGKLASHTNQPASRQEKISVAPSAAGDVLSLAVETKFPGTASFTVSAVSGGGVATWRKARSFATRDGFHGQELWWGTVTTPGSKKTLTVSYTAGAGQGTSESASSLDVQELRSSAGAATTWSVDASGTVDTGAASKSLLYPKLIPASGTDAYVGYLAVPGSLKAGSTPGVVYQLDVRGNQVVYDVAVSGAITPKASSSSAQTFSSIGMLLKAA